MRNVYHLLAWGELSGEAGAAHDKVALVPRRRAPGTEVGYLGPGPSPFPFCNVIPPILHIVCTDHKYFYSDVQACTP